MLEIDILRNASQISLGVLRGAFQGFGCPKRHANALLAKIMLAGNQGLGVKGRDWHKSCRTCSLSDWQESI